MSPTNVGTRGNLSDHLMSQSVVVVFFALYGMIPSKALKKGKVPLRGGGEKKSEGGGGFVFFCFCSVLLYFIWTTRACFFPFILYFRLSGDDER